jgi:hypothetical protein
MVRLRRFDPRIGALVAVAVAVLTATAVLATQLLALDTPVPGRGTVRLAFTGPAVQPNESPLYAIRDVLARQSTALLRGDRDGYLYTIPAEERELLEQARQRFDSLTALRVRRWSMTTAGIPSMFNGEWQQYVEIGYCFGSDDCQPIRLQVDTGWSVVRGRLRLVRYQQTSRPWDATRLTVRDGARVTVAGPADSPGILDLVLRAAEIAARVNDRFATAFSGPPQRYFVYVAGVEQWKGWYDGGSAHAAAYTRALQPGASDVVVKASSVATHAWNITLLTHEFGHVVTLDGTGAPPSTWWLTEGIAEYIANGDDMALQSDLPAVKSYLAGGRWDGTVALAQPPRNLSLEDTVARYGIALLAVTYLAKRYSEAKMLAFFNDVVRQRMTLAAASQSAFGADWQTVSTDAAASVRAAAK